VGEQEGPVVGSVAEEAARLLEALGGWASTAQDAYAARAAADAAGDDAPAAGEDAPGDAAGGPAGAPGTGTGTQGRCDSCGAENGAGQAVVCKLCPVCQGIGLLRSVRPETVDRLADLAGAVATALRDLAAHHAQSHASAPQPPSGGSRVQDIRIEDDDQPRPDEPHSDQPHPDQPQPDQRGSATS
jgi:hypothetical protein